MATESNYENLMCLAEELKGTILHGARMIATAILMAHGKWAATDAYDMVQEIEKESNKWPTV